MQWVSRRAMKKENRRSFKTILLMPRVQLKFVGIVAILVGTLTIVASLLLYNTLRENYSLFSELMDFSEPILLQFGKEFRHSILTLVVVCIAVRIGKISPGFWKSSPYQIRRSFNCRMNSSIRRIAFRRRGGFSTAMSATIATNAKHFPAASLPMYSVFRRKISSMSIPQFGRFRPPPFPNKMGTEHQLHLIFEK